MVILMALANKAALIAELSMIAAAAKMIIAALTVATSLSSVIVKPAVAVKIILASVETASAQMLMWVPAIMDKAMTRIKHQQWH